MARIGKVATAWAGTTGGPGITQLYVANTTLDALTQTQAQTAVNAVRLFWDTVKGYLPDEVLLTVQATVDQYEDTTGTLVGSITAATPPATVAGTSAAVYSMAAGIKMNLQTIGIRNGRRVRGSVYLVPGASAAMTTNGTISSTARASINTAGNQIISTLAAANMNLIVWSRPLKDAAGNVTRLGGWTSVQSVDTNEKSCILRGRRD